MPDQTAEDSVKSHMVIDGQQPKPDEEKTIVAKPERNSLLKKKNAVASSKRRGTSSVPMDNFTKDDGTSKKSDLTKDLKKGSLEKRKSQVLMKEGSDGDKTKKPEESPVGTAPVVSEPQDPHSDSPNKKKSVHKKGAADYLRRKINNLRKRSKKVGDRNPTQDTTEEVDDGQQKTQRGSHRGTGTNPLQMTQEEKEKDEPGTVRKKKRTATKESTQEDTAEPGTVRKKKASMKEEAAEKKNRSKKSSMLIGDEGEDDKGRNQKIEKLMEAEQMALAHLEWYHGLMPREEIQCLLKNDGDFCLRKTDVGKSERYALSVFWGDRVRHILPKLTSDNKWTIREVGFDKVEKLLVFFITTKAEIQTDGTKLLKPINRPDWYILHEQVTLKKKLGSGNFGDVFMAELSQKNGEVIPAAVKTLRGKIRKSERVQFVKEASLMRRFNHENIVRILGVAPQQEPIMILLELASGGALKSHCRDKIDLTVDQLTKYCLDAANGMDYLSAHLVIHRDIAARNCLLNDKNVVKISDFGLSVADHNEVKESKLKNVPVKWLAPETLMKGIFSTKSDVWSFGIMMWEIYSRCKKDPYPGMTNKETRAMVQTDARMDPPSETPSYGVELMKMCWKAKPEDRPDWPEIVKRLSEACGVKPQTVVKVKSTYDAGCLDEEYIFAAYGK
ncbi:hypothetical protein L596_009318 [Steinernema carpocapsae]|uniref:Tyrosine-protein kinase n=1 Tax=Steinernema carpocapsae TaxID=34508 RepID=A0A4V6A6J7_STECR|nr:hypothetical protein L596_009318 [Steinernema carpocapsae]